MEKTRKQEVTRLAELAHELRNRIAPIRNVAQLMRMRSGSDAGIAPLIDLIERQLDGMIDALEGALAA